MAKYLNRIAKYVSEPDKGIYDAMNKGIKLATGDILGFLNSDDFYTNNTIIRRVAAEITATDADCCYGDLEYVDRNDQNKTVRRWQSQPYFDGLFERGWHPPHPTFFAKTKIFDRYGSFDLRYQIGADYELMLRFLKKYRISSRYIHDVLVKMRNGGKSNRNLRQIIRANIECYNAWNQNGLKITPLFILKKPISKLAQYIVRHPESLR